MPKSRGNRLLWVLLLAVAAVILGSQAGSWLVVDSPQPADAIVILAGETEQRPAMGLQLLAQGLAPRLLLDAPAGSRIYRWSQPRTRAAVPKRPSVCSAALCLPDLRPLDPG